MLTPLPDPPEVSTDGGPARLSTLCSYARPTTGGAGHRVAAIRSLVSTCYEKGGLEVITRAHELLKNYVNWGKVGIGATCIRSPPMRYLVARGSLRTRRPGNRKPMRGRRLPDQWGSSPVKRIASHGEGKEVRVAGLQVFHVIQPLTCQVAICPLDVTGQVGTIRIR